MLFLHMYMGTFRALMVGQAQLSDVLLLLSSKDFPLTSLYRDEWEGSVVMFGGVDHRYYKGELSWVPLIQEGD